MGWIYDEEGCHEHEGYMVALVHRRRDDGTEMTGLYREVNYPESSAPPIVRLQAACECGWRSAHWHVSMFRPATWVPYTVHVEERGEEEVERDRAHDLWRRHIEQDVRPALKGDSARPALAERAFREPTSPRW